MLIIPAIDIRDKKVVRLHQGNFALEKVYNNSPVDTAIMWQDKGAKRLHVIDLDGAKTGVIENIDIIKKIRESTSIVLEVGGGIRDIDSIKRLIDIGIDYVILGTRAADKKFLKEAMGLCANKIIVAVDVLNEFVCIKGWREGSGIGVAEYVNNLHQAGVKTLMYTDISRDGTMSGLDLLRIRNFLDNAKIPTIISGGIASVKDVEGLVGFDKNILGVIIGKALYEGKIELDEALRIAGTV